MTHDRGGDALHFCIGRRCQSAELRRSIGGAQVDAVEDQGVEVDVQVERVAKALHEGDGAAAGDAGLHAEASADVAGSEVRVGRLAKLLRSKQLSGRPKDVAFLRSFAAEYEDESGD